MARADRRGEPQELLRSSIGEQVARRRPPLPDLHYLFAPLKHARLDYMVQKAVEMGAGRLRPVLTQHTQVSRVNLERMQANAIEAAEQCGILAIPRVRAAAQARATCWRTGTRERRLFFCDEERRGRQSAPKRWRHLPRGPLALLIGPEGGFSDEERATLLARPYVTPLSLGPRILRADTAAVAALALVQAFIGDWR